MGGFNSGSLRRSDIATTDVAITLSIARLKLLSSYSHARMTLESDINAAVELEITAEEGGYHVCSWLGTRTRYGFGDGTNEVQRSDWRSPDSMFIALTATRPNYGGVRLWFVCPRSDCGRRCGVLYREQHTNARAFVCFACSWFVYASQRLSRIDRAEYRSAKLAQRLVVSKDGRSAYSKPKWMRWRTFDRIVGEIDANDKRWRPLLSSQFARFTRLVDGVEEMMSRRLDHHVAKAKASPRRRQIAGQ
jgi:hypothetical protein